MDEFSARYRQAGSPLAPTGNAVHKCDVATPDFTDWQMQLCHSAIDDYIAEREQEGHNFNAANVEELQKLQQTKLLCCPEDVKCSRGNHAPSELCLDCQFPLCVSCQLALQSSRIVPMGLANDNWYGYLQKWIYEMDITWMEKTVASPFWTGMTLFTIAERGGKRRHLLEEKMYQAPRRVAFKGQVFSAPTDRELTRLKV